MATIIPVASGKGGTGKTLFVTNLGVALAQRDNTVILVDLDLGCSNLHTCLGIKNLYAGIGNYIHKKESLFESLIKKTGIKNLSFIPGDSLLPATANLSYLIKTKIIKNIQKLTTDYVILDLGAGTNYNVMDFFLISSSGILVTTPEPTAILNAYSFLKNLLFRLIYRSFQPKSKERKYILEFIKKKIETSTTSFLSLITILQDINAESGKIAETRIGSILPRIVLNMGKTKNDIHCGINLRQIVRKNLGINLEYIGFIFKEDEIVRSIINRKPYLLDYPRSKYAASISNIANKLTIGRDLPVPELYETNEDLKNLWETL